MKNKKFVFLTTFFFILAVGLLSLFSPLRVLILGFQKSEISQGEEVTEQVISEPNYCMDSDNGVDYYTAGFVDINPVIIGDEAYDYCDNGNLIEYYCSGNERISDFYQCNQGCDKGACKEEGEKQPILPEFEKNKTCTDSDNGKNYNLKGSVVEYEDSLLLRTETDYCKDNQTLVEVYCSEGSLTSEEYNCLNGNECKDGICAIIIPSAIPQPQPPTPIPSTCSDSDGGIDYNVAGTSIDSSFPSGFRDYCVENTLFEYYCADFGAEGYKTEVQQYVCPYGCYNGICSECIEGQEVCVNSETIKSCKDGKGVFESCAGKCSGCICSSILNKCVKPEPVLTTSCPSDTICKSYWPTNEGTQIYVNGGLQSSCNLFEVCNPALDKYVEESRNACIGNSNQKRCLGLYIINALGKEAKFMQGYFTPEICCSADINDPVDRDHCRAFSFFGKCDSAEDPIVNFNSFAKQLKCSTPISSFRWASDTDMSQNTCKFITPPAHATLNILRTGTCEDYSVALTTLLRKSGYSPAEVMSVAGFRHIYNLVKFPGDAKYHFIDTTGNGKGLAENVFRLYDIPLGKSRFEVNKVGNADGMKITIDSHVYYDYCSLAMEKCYNDNGIAACPSKNQIYGCEVSHRYYLDSCRVEWGIVKATCDQCWYSFKSSIQIEGCCKIKEWWGQYTKCEDMNIDDLMSQI